VDAGESSEAASEQVQRTRRFRRTVVFLLLAIALILLALLLLALATPGWLPDGSRPAYPASIRALIGASLVAGTVLVPVGVRELVLALLPNEALGLILALVIGMAGLIAAPVEIWVTMVATAELEAGAQQRYESDDDVDFDWD
jgi:O-antigen/teichoic acid export membrane protein